MAVANSIDKCSGVHRISNRDNVGNCDSIYRIGDRILRWSTETRDLGVIIDKLNFNSHISAIAHKAHVRSSLILRTFVTRDPIVLTKAFITYVRPILELYVSVVTTYSMQYK